MRDVPGSVRGAGAGCAGPAGRRGGRSCGRRAGRRRVSAASAASTRRAQSSACVRRARSAAWIGATWRGWMHSFAPKPCRRDQARSASRRGSSSSCGVTPATGVAMPGARGRPRPAGLRRRTARRTRRRGRGRGRARSRACRRRAGRRPVGAGDLLGRRDAARALDQREHGRVRRGGSARPRRRRPTRPWAASRAVSAGARPAAARSCGEAGEPSVVDAHDDCGPGRRVAACAAQARDGVAGGVLGVGGDRVLEVEHDGIGAAGQGLAEPVGPVARDEQVGAGVRSVRPCQTTADACSAVISAAS